MNDLQRLHQAANNTLLGRLHLGLSGLRGSPSDLSQAAEALATRALVPADAAQAVDAGHDFGGDQSEGWDDCLGTQGVRGAV